MAAVAWVKAELSLNTADMKLMKGKMCKKEKDSVEEFVENIYQNKPEHINLNLRYMRPKKLKKLTNPPDLPQRKMRKLKEEGKAMQSNGNLDGAIEKYEEVLRTGLCTPGEKVECWK